MRRLLMIAACLSIALGGICGMHAHLERVVATGDTPVASYSIHIEAEIGAAHEADHDEAGEIDVSLLAMLVGSLALLGALCLLLAGRGFAWIPRRSPPVRVRLQLAPAVRPVQRLIYYLHPPSHAPPFPAH